jgi:tRNA(Ile)-lysidine synthase
MGRMDKKLLESFNGEAVALAVSGGADSMAMLHMAAAQGANIAALTVDHGLRRESAAEARAVARECARLGVRHAILEWSCRKAGNLEAAARKARYDLMIGYCKKNNIGVLCTAHQADDQIETFLMNLARGSGVYGLGGIRERRMRGGIMIFRPMLGFSRADLAAYCDANGIRCASDPMNEDEGFARVKIRRNRACLAERLGISDGRLLLAIENLARARDFIEAGARRIAGAINPVEFDAAILLGLPDELRCRVLSMLLSDGYPPRLSGIKNALAKLDGGAAKFTLAGKNIRILGGRIRIWKEGEKWRKF